MLSVVVPIGDYESRQDIVALVGRLECLPSGSEILLVSQEANVFSLSSQIPFKWVTIQLPLHTNARGYALNQGAKQASNKHLWFLHADSVFDSGAVKILLATIAQNPSSFLYFWLAFLGKSPMWLNAHGANIRSRLFHAPFGDQGFCISAEIFASLGGYEEKCQYGEDHLFACKAHYRRIPFVQVNAHITTSARKYERKGWLKTTLLHQYLWVKQYLWAYYIYKIKGEK